jgi:MFS family permease
MLAALMLPKVLDYITDRIVMLWGSVLMSLGLIAIYTGPGYAAVLPIWFVIGVGWSVVQTPAGRVVNRSSSIADRTSYFSAQFALTHACWMFAYPIAGLLGAELGIGTTALVLGIAVGVFAVVGALIWPRHDPMVVEHSHAELSHKHGHIHDEHHEHPHLADDDSEAHGHEHMHKGITHSHVFVIDGHHPLWPD